MLPTQDNIVTERVWPLLINRFYLSLVALVACFSTHKTFFSFREAVPPPFH